MVIFSIFFKIYICCVYPLESPYDYIQHSFSRKNIISLMIKYIFMSAIIKHIGIKNEFEIAVVNEPSVFESSNV